MGDIVGRLFREFAVTLERDDPGLGGRVADADADDVREAAAPPARVASRAGSTARRSAAFDAVDRVLRADAAAGCCGIRPRRCWSPSATLVADGPALRRRAQGLLPGAGHRRDPGHLRGAADDLVRRRWPSASRRWPTIILKDPAVESLSSFIGVDGTNTTLNSGRIQINLKPLDERKISASDVIRRLQPQLAQGRGHHALHAAGAGPDGRGSRQPDAVPVQPRRCRRRRSWRRGRRGSSRSCRRCRSCATSPAISRTTGCRRALVIDRDTASRLGITPQVIDDTLYDAFGQRQVSTMFTQLNQYHVVLEVDAGVSAASPTTLQAHLRPVADRTVRCR